MRLSGQIQACLCSFSFLRKHVTSKNQLTKQKQASTKQQRQQFFARTKTSNFLFTFGCFFHAQNLFVKKNKQAWNCLCSLKYYTTNVCSYQPSYQEFICTHLFLFVWIFDHLWKSFLFYDHLWESLLSWSSVKIYFFKSLWK